MAASVYTVGFPPCGGGLHILLTLPFSLSPLTENRPPSQLHRPVSQKEGESGRIWRHRANCQIQTSKCEAKSTTWRISVYNIL